MVSNRKRESTRKKRFVINLTTALLFTLFTAYQCFLVFQIDAQRVGRILGIVVFSFLTAASVFALIPKPVFRLIGSVLLVVSLSAYFFLKLLSFQRIFGALNFSKPVTVLNAGVFIATELAVFVMLAYYLVLRRNIAFNATRKPTVIVMSVVIALSVITLILESVLLIKFRVNIELSLKLTLLSKLVFCLAFVSMSIGFTLPLPLTELAPPDKNTGDAPPNPALGEVNKDFIL